MSANRATLKGEQPIMSRHLATLAAVATTAVAVVAGPATTAHAAGTITVRSTPQVCVSDPAIGVLNQCFTFDFTDTVPVGSSTERTLVTPANATRFGAKVKLRILTPASGARYILLRHDLVFTPTGKQANSITRPPQPSSGVPIGNAPFTSVVENLNDGSGDLPANPASSTMSYHGVQLP
jgi:hypothetical protein